MSFDIQKLKLSGVLLITPKRFEDERGFSMTSYTAQAFRELQLPEFVQEYVSFSKPSVLRGLHYQKSPYAQDKLIRCVSGSVFDVVADYDESSKTFGTYLSVVLDALKGQMLFVPGRYAHGFCVTDQEGAQIEYKMNESYHPESAGGVRFDDPLFNIAWPVQHPILSSQDTKWPLFQKDL